MATKRPRRLSVNSVKAMNDYRALVEAIGHLVVYWGLIERQIDNWVMVAFHECGGKHIEKTIPRMFKRKRQFLKKCFKRLAPLQPFQDAAVEILNEAKEVGGIRNDIVHGNIRKLASDRGVYRFDILDAQDDYHTVRTMELNLHQFPVLEKRTAKLLTRARRMSQELTALFP